MPDILFVEDDATIAMGVEYSLKQDGFQVSLAYRLEEARDLLRRSPFGSKILIPSNLERLWALGWAPSPSEWRPRASSSKHSAAACAPFAIHMRIAGIYPRTNRLPTMPSERPRVPPSPQPPSWLPAVIH